MSLKTGLVVLLLCMPGLLCAEWGGTYSEEEICAIKGSTVKIQCDFKFPATENGREIKVKDTFWFTKDPKKDLRLDPQYFGGVQSECHGNICSLTIADVRRSDEYTFRFTTDHSRGDFIVRPGVNVTVTDLKVQVTWQYRGYHRDFLKCVSTNCSTWSPSSYVWYKNGEEIQDAKSQEYTEYDYVDSYSCAVRGHEQAVSPPECVGYRPCNKVVYHKRHICAIQGSSVDITCEYTSYEYNQTTLWFRTDSSHSGNPSLTEDPQYEGRLELPSESSGNSTLRIKDVRQSDSAEYRFKFTTHSGWSSISPGSTLTVAAVQVQVMSVRVEDSHLVAQMLCHTSCLPEDPFYFEWQKNGEDIAYGPKVEVPLSPGDYITCAAQQHQHFSISPHLYVLKRPSVSLSDTGDILEGRPLTLTCDIDNFNYSSATDDYCWYKKKNVFSDDEVLRKGRELVFQSIKSSDSAEYWCTVENQLGKNASEPVFIDVQYPPRWSSLSVSPSPVILEGQSVNLTCSSDAKPAANYTWFMDNQILTQNPQGLYSFTSIHPEDAGTFHCMSENKHGRVKSSTVVIDVQYVLKRPSVSLSPIGDILEGRPLTLTCDINNYDYSSATDDYCWYKKKNVSSDDEVLSKGRQLVFQSIKSSDSAEYWCTVENQLGKKTSEPVFIDVQYAPKRPYVSVVQSNELAAGSLVNLTCSSNANPAASYTWYKENMSSPLASGQTLTIKDISPGQTLTIKDISPGQTLTIKDISPGQTLAIRNVTEQGGHDYYCEANNSRGRHIIGVHVSVNGMSCRTINIIRLFCSAVVFVGILIILTLEFRTTSPSSTADPNELVETVEELDPGDYENIDAEDSL